MYDSHGNVATGYTGTVSFASGDSQAGLPVNYTFTTGTGKDNGVHTFSVTLKTAGTQYLTATDTTTSSITGTQSGIIVQAAGAVSLSVAGFPTPDTAGVAHNLTVTAYDPYGNIATGYTGTVAFTSGDSQAGLPANYTFTTGTGKDNGVHTFSVTLKTAGTQYLTATDTTTSSITGTQSGIVVLAAGAVSLSVAGFPTPDTAGVAHNFTVTAYDPYGNVATGYTGKVAFTSGDSQAGLPVSYTFTTGTGKDNGVHTFSATLNTAGTRYLTATDTTTSSITGTQSGIIVQAAGAVSLSVAGFPTPDTAGVAHNFTVTAYDPYGNVATGYTGTVGLTSGDSQAVLPASYTFTTGTGKDNGVHTFSATLNTAGTQYLTATDTTTSSITGTQSGIVVQAVASGLVAEWTFDEGSGTTAGDATGNNHTGTLVGNVTWTAGEVGPSALSFNPTTGTNPHVVVADAPDLRFSSTQSFTLGAWVYVAALPGQWTAIVAKSRDHAPWYGLWISNTNHWVAGGPANLTGGLVTTGWHYLTLVQNGTANQRLLYVDGVQAASGPAQNANGPGDLWIGGAKSVSEYLDGSVDDVRSISVLCRPRKCRPSPPPQPATRAWSRLPAVIPRLACRPTSTSLGQMPPATPTPQRCPAARALRPRAWRPARSAPLTPASTTR